MINEIAKRCIKKAKTDLITAKILLDSDDLPTESICFHAQQAVEKFLKAYLTSINVKTGKTHDIATLLELCIEKNKDFINLDIDKLEELTFTLLILDILILNILLLWKKQKNLLSLQKNFMILYKKNWKIMKIIRMEITSLFGKLKDPNLVREYLLNETL